MFGASSKIYGNNDQWRQELTDSWSDQFAGVAFNTWNGYTQAYAAVPFKRVPFTEAAPVNTANFTWLRQLFLLASAG